MQFWCKQKRIEEKSALSWTVIGQDCSLFCMIYILLYTFVLKQYQKPVIVQLIAFITYTSVHVCNNNAFDADIKCGTENTTWLKFPFGHGPGNWSQRFTYSLCYWNELLHWLINYIDTQAKMSSPKKLTCKETLRQVFIRVYRLEIQSVMLIFSTQLCELLPL